MDSMGRLLEIMLLIIILFMVPSVWVLGHLEADSEENVGRIVSDFLDRVEADGYVGEEHFKRLNIIRKSVRGSSIDIRIIRENGVFKMDELMNSGGDFDLFVRDRVIITVYSGGERIYGNVRVVT